jgi:HEAT repeat protein
MGLFDLLKRGSPTERALKDLREPYAQPDVRRAAMGKLLELGSEEAYHALLVRFTFQCHGHIADESEKRDLVDELVKIGRPALGPIRAFLQKEKAVQFPIRALSRICERPETLATITEVLQGIEPMDHRTTEQKRGLVDALGELGGSADAPVVVPYLKDHHDDVQAQAIDTLERLKNATTFGALADVCASDMHSARVQRRAAQALEHLTATVAKDSFERWPAELRGEYQLDGKGVLVKKARPA